MQTILMPTALLLAITIVEAAAQDPVGKARESYAAAAYEECIDALDRVEVPPQQTAQAGEYRALCLLALDRDTEAAATVEEVIRAVPTYSAARDSSPRLKALVGTVRKTILPSLVQAEYAAAKRAYDMRDTEKAGEGFRLVLQLLKDPELAAAGDLMKADYQTLASGFLDLIEAAEAPAAPPPAAEVPIYTAESPDVTAPVPQHQLMPRWSRPAASLANMKFRGILELLIDADGRVEAATLLDPVHPSYDDMLLRAAREWTYEPARRSGQAVRFRRVMAINLEAY